MDDGVLHQVIPWCRNFAESHLNHSMRALLYQSWFQIDSVIMLKYTSKVVSFGSDAHAIDPMNAHYVGPEEFFLTVSAVRDATHMYMEHVHMALKGFVFTRATCTYVQWTRCSC